MRKVAPGANTADTRPLLTRAEVAARMKVSTRTVQRWIDDGDLRVVRFGRSVRIHEADLQAFIHAHRS